MAGVVHAKSFSNLRNDCVHLINISNSKDNNKENFLLVNKKQIEIGVFQSGPETCKTAIRELAKKLGKKSNH